MLFSKNVPDADELIKVIYSESWEKWVEHFMHLKTFNNIGVVFIVSLIISTISCKMIK